MNRTSGEPNYRAKIDVKYGHHVIPLRPNHKYYTTSRAEFVFHMDRLQRVLNGELAQLWNAFGWIQTGDDQNHWNRVANRSEALTEEDKEFLQYLVSKEIVDEGEDE